MKRNAGGKREQEGGGSEKETRETSAGDRGGHRATDRASGFAVDDGFCAQHVAQIMAQTTLEEVAKAAGVSKSTVSRALRNHPRISKATCERIQALVKTLEYRPDPLIATWINRRWGRGGREIETIAWVTAYPARDEWKVHPFTRRVFHGAETRAKERGYRLEAFWAREPRMTGARLSHILTSRGIRGVCVATLPKGLGQLSLKWEEFSCAAVGYSMHQPELHRASPHHFQGIGLALRSLRAAGHQRIGVWIDRNVSDKVDHNWMAGVLLFQNQHPDAQVSLLVSAATAKVAEFEAWYRRHGPDVMLASDNFVWTWLNALGLKLPVATLAWEPGSRQPGLDQRPYEVGEAAVDLVIGQLQRNEKGIPRVPRVVMVEGDWREAAGVDNKTAGRPAVAVGQGI